jgi:hypothetical protein
MTRVDLARADEIGSGLPSGTAFPGTPTTDDLFHRTDRDLIYRYDGTRWLCICPHELPGAQQAFANTTTSSTVTHRFPIPQENGGFYAEKLRCVTFVGTTNTGAAFWTYTLDRRNGANTNTNIGSFNTSADTVNNWVEHILTIGAAYAPGNALIALLTLTKTSTPGEAWAIPTLVGRYIG